MDIASTLPVPGRALFAIPEGSVEVLLSTTLSRRAATRLAMAAETPHGTRGKLARGKTAKPQARHAAHAAPAAPKHAAQVKNGTPRPTRVASLKKRA